MRNVSIHAAQTGCDNLEYTIKEDPVKFQFTQPKRAATFTTELDVSADEFQFTQPKRAATFHY